MSRKFPIFQRLSSIKFTFSEIKQQNFYQRLGLNKTSSKVDIKSAFYKLGKMIFNRIQTHYLLYYTKLKCITLTKIKKARFNF